jgi:hypothetical protein
MNETQFCYWLQGHFGLMGDNVFSGGLSGDQCLVIKNHLDLVFEKVTPNSKIEDLISIPKTEHKTDRGFSSIHGDIKC